MPPRDAKGQGFSPNRADGARFRVGLLVIVSLLLFIRGAQAMPRCREDTTSRVSFTNLATHLLESELNITYRRIQVYPTNEYTPSVHRILQVCANLHEAGRRLDTESARQFPSVFKPLFSRDADVIYIRGYEEIDADARSLLTPARNLGSTADRDQLSAQDNVSGVPWIIAAVKGLPNFNELSVQNTFEITRILELRAPAANTRPNETNQLLLISLNSSVGVEAWNSYRSQFTNATVVYATNLLEVTLCVTNQPSGNGSEHRWRMLSAPSLTTTTNWPGTEWGVHPSGDPNPQSFRTVLMTNSSVITNATFRANGLLETTLAPTIDRANANMFPTPDITVGFTNRLQFAMIDQDSGRVLDYVHLIADSRTKLTEILSLTSRRSSLDNERARLWSTNRIGSAGINSPTQGIIRQILVSGGFVRTQFGDWLDYGVGNAPSGNLKQKEQAENEQAKFRDLLVGRGTNLVMRAPFRASRRISVYTSWQANDPLVHYLQGDLARLDIGDAIQELPLTAAPQELNNIGQLTQRYEPWGGNPSSSAVSRSAARRNTNPIFKDPLVRSSDDWNFPAGERLDPIALGRIHRGTPWQTLYAKAGEVWPGRDGGARREWREWTGNANRSDAALTFPQRDWHILSHLGRRFWPDKPNNLLSVNEPKRHRWLKALRGIEVLTNTVPDEAWVNYDPTVVPQFETEVIRFKSPQAESIVDEIATNRLLEPKGYFGKVGDILGVEALSTQSPFLSLSAGQRTEGISDQAYEAIPLQLLPKLRPDSVGSWVMKNGKPHLQFSGLERCVYRIETSSDMIHWTPVCTARTQQGCIELDVLVDPTEACRFYRSVLIEHGFNREQPSRKFRR